MQSDIEAIRSCSYLLLESIAEPDENSLLLVLLEARASDKPAADRLSQMGVADLRQVLAGAREVIHTTGCRRFELYWPSYVGYAIENESCAQAEPDDSVGQGRLVVLYTKSLYLDYLAKASFASDEHPGPYRHWAVCCLNHIINIASCDQPIVTASNGV